MPQWRRNLWVVAVADFVTIVGMSAFLPFFPDVLRQTGLVGGIAVGATLAAVLGGTSGLFPVSAGLMAAAAFWMRSGD